MPENIRYGVATNQVRFNGITPSREKLIKKCVTSVLSGKQNLNDAIKKSQHEGPIASLTTAITKFDDSAKHQTIEKAFMHELSICKLITAKAKLEKLITSLDTQEASTDSIPDHGAELWGIFSTFNIKAPSINTSASFVVQNDQLKLTMNLISEERNETIEINFKNNSNTARISLEYDLYKKWHNDTKIPEVIPPKKSAIDK